jgi:hypothetical protein
MRSERFPSKIREIIYRNYGQLSAAELTTKINSSKTAQRLHVRYTMPTIRTTLANLSRGYVLRTDRS